MLGPEHERADSECVAVDVLASAVAGCATIAAGGVPLTDLPSGLTKRLPRYLSVPVGRVGRLAVATACQVRKLSAALLVDASVRAMRSEVAVFGLVVDAKDETAEAFYRHHGFERFGTAARQLIMPLLRFASAAE